MIEDKAPGQHKAQQVARMKRQRNAGEAISNGACSRIPLRSIRATHWNFMESGI
jgi:hypothetical protein